MYEERIWRFLKGKLLSDCGAAGLMGNLYAESGLYPVKLQNTHERKLGLSDKEYTQQVDFGLYADFVHDGAGYGLAQWTFWSRKQNLLAFAKSREKSIGDLNKYGRAGVAALSSATPVDSGETAASWYYEITNKNNTITTSFHNSNIQNGVPIAILLQYGHGTGTGGWVQGRDYINPAIQPIFDQIAEYAWKEVTRS